VLEIRLLAHFGEERLEKEASGQSFAAATIPPDSNSRIKEGACSPTLLKVYLAWP
jgi:hypothetical protein